MRSRHSAAMVSGRTSRRHQLECSVLPPRLGRTNPPRRLAPTSAIWPATSAPCYGPSSHRYPLVDWVLSPVPELCEREGVAVVLDFAPEAVKWAEAVAFARHYSPVPMVILETARRTTENAEGLGEQDRAAILSENAQ